MINKKRLIKLTRSLIRINSENPPGNEVRIATFVKDYLENLGLRPKIHEFEKGRLNVVAVLKGENKKHSLLITPHLDTVPAGKNWRCDPFSGKIYQGKIFGLGATDCKGNLACALEAINSIVEAKAVLNYNLVFAATADEESGSGAGLIPLLNRKILNPDAALILDSDDFDIIITQKGLIHLKVEIRGKKAHGAYPWRGINAIDIALNILKEIKAYKFISSSGKEPSLIYRKYLRPSTINIGTIKGGDKVNVVADWCEFELDFRFLPGESAKNILEDIRGIISKHAKNSKIKIEGIQKPYWIDEKHSLVEYLTRSMRKMKIGFAIKGSEGATVISFFQDKGIPAIATGFGCEGCCHVADEYVKIDNLYRGAKVLEEFLKTYQFNS
jgi:succinyl-diaminopimelate desuccinylase